jgi:predicted phosphodiesterase
MINQRLRLNKNEIELITLLRQTKKSKSDLQRTPESNEHRILVVSDLHQPWTHPQALEHCMKTYNKYECNEVVFIGDILDNSATTRWETNPDNKSAKDELEMAIEALKPWYKAFPQAIALTGNHEARIMKKLQRGSVSENWLKNFNEVLEVPQWKFTTEVIIGRTKYLHGEGCSSTLQALLQSNTNIVFGHFHSKFEIIYNQDRFAMCVGCLVDKDAIAFNYARTFVKQQIIGCGVVLNDHPILVPIKLN